MDVVISRINLPTIDRIGLFPLLNPAFNFSYRNPTNALHLYDYHARIRIASAEYLIRPGDITCIQAGTVYSIASDEPGQHWCVHYYDQPGADDATITLPPHVHLGVNSLFYRQQIQLISQLSFRGQRPEAAKDDMCEEEARFRLKALLIALHNHGANPDSRRRSANSFSWNELLGWMDENLDQVLSLSLLAERVRLTPNTLSKKFKQTHGTTLLQYLLQRRIDKAKSLLATTALTVYEVGEAVGIPDPQYFNKQFRKVTGVSPSRYREDNQEQLSSVSNQVATQEGSWQDDSSRL